MPLILFYDTFQKYLEETIVSNVNIFSIIIYRILFDFELGIWGIHFLGLCFLSLVVGIVSNLVLTNAC